MRIGIYGGSFNPVHIGHTSLAQAICEQKLVDEVWLVVSPLNPFKRNRSDELLDDHIRLEMAKIATRDISCIKVSDIEFNMPKPSYTYDTLKALKQRYPQHKFSLIIGADNWISFSKWYKSDEIMANYNIIVYRRPGCEIDLSSVPKNVTVASTELYNVSSTQIREGIKNGSDVSMYLNPKVYNYIKTNGLYK